MRFRRRLVIAVVGVTAVTLGGAFVAIAAAVNASQQRQLDQALVAEAHQEASEAAQLGGDKLAISERPGPMGDDIGPLTKYGVIYSAAGDVLAATDTFVGHPPALAAVDHSDGKPFDTWRGAEHLRAVIVAVPRHEARLMLAAPRADLDADAAFQTRAMWVVLGFAVLWAALVASWVVRRLTRGHEEIAAVARRVAAGDLGARVRVAADDEIGQLAADINGMVDQLAALLSAQREFVAHAAHELRSPITSLYGELSLALRRSRDAEGYKHSIEESLEAARRLKALTEELLTLARVSAHEADTATPVDLGGVAVGARTEVIEAAAARGITVDIDGTAPPVRGQPGDLQRLLRNLLENAVRHSPDGGTVRVHIATDGARARVTVADRGPGVSAAERDHIFDPFFRGRAVDAHASGAGLGLAIARRIAVAHGGELRLDDTAAPGATFAVLLPIA